MRTSIIISSLSITGHLMLHGHVPRGGGGKEKEKRKRKKERKRERKRKEGVLVANGKEVDGGREAAIQSLMLQFHSIK